MALRGKSPGGISYGYDVVRKFDANGEPIRDERKINEKEAAIVRRILTEYVSGKSPKGIAAQLNREGIAGPRGGAWGQSTINGNRKRGSGILNNELYIGTQIWNRQSFCSNPDTGKRESRPNPPEKWVVTEIPELRIIDDELWDQVKQQQAALEHDKPQFWQKQRPRNLLSGLLSCGCCGGGFSKISKQHVGCSNLRNKGTCNNSLSIKMEGLETMVLSALKTRLMDRELVKEFCDEYTRHINQLRIEHNASLNAYRAEFERNKRELDKLLDAIGGGLDPQVVKSRFNELGARQRELEAIIASTEEAPVLLHPNMAGRYQAAVSTLMASLKTPENRVEASQILRGLIDRIVLSPDERVEKLVVDLHGDLAGILQIASGSMEYAKDKRQKTQRNSGLSDDAGKLVAGAGFEPAPFWL